MRIRWSVQQNEGNWDVPDYAFQGAIMFLALRIAVVDSTGCVVWDVTE